MADDSDNADWEPTFPTEEQACTKEEYAVAKYLRFNTPAHTGRLAGMTVKCFIASEAVNCLMDSKWAKGKASQDSEIVFTDRKSVVHFLNSFIAKGLFHRADKVEKKKDKEKKKKRKELEEKEKQKEKDKESATDEKKSKKEKRLQKQTEKEAEETKKEEKKADDKTKTRKFKLNMSEDQRFVDGSSIYVWIYDPIHPKTFVIGLLMLVGAAALCLFPLWPDWMRIAVYYCSLLGASFVGFMLFLIVFRVIIFCIVWAFTLGKHHFWIFPNLTEDVGVIESFKPLYQHDVYPPPELEAAKLKKKKEEEEARENEEDDESDNDDKNNDNDDDDKNDDDFEILKDDNETDNKTEEESDTVETKS